MKRLVAAVVGLVLVVTGCTTGKDAVVTGGSFNFVSPGGKVDITYDVADRQPSPTLSGDDLMNEGKQLSIADFPGKVVVLNLWGQWCGPCRVEAPEMQKVFDRTKASGVQVVGIDLRDNDRTPAQDFVRDRKLTYPSIYDPSGRTLLQLSGYPRNIIPSTIVLDKQHRVAAVFLRDLLASDLLPVVERLVAEPA
ncbi:TlpA disulfide reductase family protein [Amycolatopsis sp. QT-25]|uniref:TlpA family protein disulfide reductase n=1 Tax=Amycolatopsis sp. QT-25 TaxID=3034022 RepID=UPI0023ECA063|nr:TlpA disulfide reductase family protein [Amycolatopsis sp. QT-25]WET80130.1 TlpA disulfide reductase family protein [Amycolatopsis sp. QT-25]